MKTVIFLGSFLIGAILLQMTINTLDYVGKVNACEGTYMLGACHD